jgi:hypothetical protein
VEGGRRRMPAERLPAPGRPAPRSSVHPRAHARLTALARGFQARR